MKNGIFDGYFARFEGKLRRWINKGWKKGQKMKRNTNESDFDDEEEFQ